MAVPTTVAVDDEELRLDRAAKRFMGTEKGGTVEQLLDANPGLASELGWVPQGTRLVVPARADNAPKVLPSVNPWD